MITANLLFPAFRIIDTNSNFVLYNKKHIIDMIFKINDAVK
jgi:hypothetical protein